MLGFINLASPTHILVIGVVALLLFGNRLPEVARSLGRALNEFKRGLKDVGDDIDEADRKVSAESERQKLTPPTATPRSESKTPEHETEDSVSRS